MTQPWHLEDWWCIFLIITTCFLGAIELVKILVYATRWLVTWAYRKVNQQPRKPRLAIRRPR